MEKIIKHIADNSGAEILVFEMSENIEKLEKEIENFPIYSDEFNKIKTSKRKIEFLNARFSLNFLCKRAVYVKYDNTGKPFIDDNSFQISISHSSRWMAVAIHPVNSIGIDVELNSERASKIKDKFLTAEEQEQIGKENPALNFLLAWSAKEALYKIIGHDAVDFRKQLRIFPFERTIEGEMKMQHIPANKIFHPKFLLFTDFVVVYCID